MIRIILCFLVNFRVGSKEEWIFSGAPFHSVCLLGQWVSISAGALQLNNRSLTRCLKSAIRSARLGTHTRLATKFERFPALITSGVLGHVWKKTLCKRKRYDIQCTFGEEQFWYF